MERPILGRGVRDDFYRAVLSFADGDLLDAVDRARVAAASDPKNLVYSASVTHLEYRIVNGQPSAYASPEGFRAFVRGGGNIPLYENTSAALRAAYREYDSIRVLDIGTGDGLALIPALTGNIRHLDVLEPSAPLLSKLEEQLQASGHAYRAFQTTLQDFVCTCGERWDVVQATYSLQSLPFDERAPLVRWLRAHAGRLLVAEFDAPDFRDPTARQRVEYVVERYQRGLAEYPGDETVIQGFLMPIMWSYFDPSVARMNYEQPITEWTRLLADAGFEQIVSRPIYPYWWATAHVIDAR